MPDKFEIKISEGITAVRLLKKLSLPEVLEVIDEVARIQTGTRRLVDLTGCFAFTTKEVQEIASRGRVHWPSAARVAFVAEDDLSFGLLRMFEVYREQEDYETKVFRDKNRALVWLKQ